MHCQYDYGYDNGCISHLTTFQKVAALTQIKWVIVHSKECIKDIDKKLIVLARFLYP